mgnify:CR=1 FL=1
MEDFIMYEKYLEQLEEAGKIRNLKDRSISCYKTMFLTFPSLTVKMLFGKLNAAFSVRLKRVFQST